MTPAAPAPTAVGQVLLGLAVVVAVSALGGVLFRALRQPAVVGEVLAGVVLGPSVLGALAPGLAARLIPAGAHAFLQLLASVGLAVFMLMVGMEVDGPTLRRRRRVLAAVTPGAVALPFLLGAGLVLLASAAGPGTAVAGLLSGTRVPVAALAGFVGIALTVTAVPVLARLLRERGLHGTELGSLALAAAAATDLLVWVLLAVLLAVVSADGGVGPALLGTAALAVATLGVLRPLLLVAERRGLLERIGPRGVLAGAVVAALAAAGFGQEVGLHGVVGPLLVGLALPRSGTTAGALRSRLEDTAAVLLLPPFFVVAGLGVDLTTLGVSGLLALGVLLVAITAVKVAATALPARWSGLPRQQALRLGVLMVGQGLTALVVLQVGLSAGLLGTRLYTVLVATALLTTALTSPLLSLTGLARAARGGPGRSTAPPVPAAAAVPAPRPSSREVPVMSVPTQPEAPAAEARTTTVDVVVLGSGIGGATVAALLARSGVSVGLLDGARHPRFALGESTIGETSFLLRQMAARYDVPELAHVSTSAGLREHVSRKCGIKRNFGFVYQRAGQEHASYEVTQCNVSSGPFGPESHLMRGDVDHYLFKAAVKYGAVAREGIRISNVDVREDGVRVDLADGESFEARYVIDATGRTSVLANQFGLREEPCRFKTDSRTIFTHMRGVKPYDDVDGGSGQPSPWHEGTLHHLFDGGWLWVIPFDNHDGAESDLVSVGLNLDSRRHPKREGVTAEEEWAEFLAAHPTVAKQFEGAESAFKWISTGRTQFSSSQTVGDRWVLMSHAAGAIDALFSRGMANTMAVIEAFVPILMTALDDGNFSAERFAYIETLNQSILDNNDKLIAGSYIAFRDFDLWRAWSKMWYLAWNLGVIRIAGSYYRYLETGDTTVLDRLHEAPLPGTWCPELVSAQEQYDACFAIMEKVEAGEITPQDAVPQLAFLLGDGEASPSPLNLHDVLRRWHDGSATTQKLIHEWGRTVAPVELRHYFDYDRSTIELAARQVLDAGREPVVPESAEVAGAAHADDVADVPAPARRGTAETDLVGVPQA